MNKKLDGSTLIEVIVASTLFLLVFAISLSTIVKVSRHDSNTDLDMIEADYQTDMVKAYYMENKLPHGEYEHEYSWGTIRVELTRYEDYDRLDLLTVSVSMNNSLKRTVSRQIIELGNEDR